MGRQQGFETSAVVRAAREVFWEHGYEGASVPALERATGLGRSSLYHAFGSKRGLFDAAVTSYLDEVVRPRLRPLQQPDAAPGALAGYLGGLREAVSRGTTSGCLLLNAATAPIGGDDAVAATVAAYRAELVAALAAGVRAASPSLSAPLAAHRADTLTGLVLAAFALARPDPAAAAGCLDTALRVASEGGQERTSGTLSTSR